jgi:enoyl-CoA hydratase/carnithine racemase
MMNASDVLIKEEKGKGGNLGIITLNRPQALNALTPSMCQHIKQALDDWENSSLIKAVMIRGSGERAFCAGGDLRHLYQTGKENPQEAKFFFYHEYRMNYRIFNFAKPYIALLDGITMGGGVGLSVYGNQRIATEKLLWAMPETGIGYFADVGASYFLSHSPGYMGFYLGLTGARINAADCYYLGLIDQYINSSQIDNFLAKLLATPFDFDANQTVTDILSEFTLPLEDSTLAKYRTEIDTCFAHNTMEDIIHALQRHKNPWCHEVAQLLLTKSPISLKVTLEALQRGKQFELANCLSMEYRLGQHFLYAHDFYEGIEAVVINKNQVPRWSPSKLEKISKGEVEKFFQATGFELDLSE